MRVWERDRASTAAFLTGVLGFTDFGEEDGWHRYGVDGGGSGKHIEIREMPNEARGDVGRRHDAPRRVARRRRCGRARVRERVATAHRRPTEVIDRFWFKSVYFLEPGGVLFELATDGPGFTADEVARAPRRDSSCFRRGSRQTAQEIEASLPVLSTPATASSVRRT